MAAGIWGLHWLATDQPERSRISWLAGLLPWLRPDLALLSVLLWLRRFRTVPDHRRRDTLILAGCGLAGGAVLFAAIGTPVPNTLAAKREFFASSHASLYVKTAVTASMLLIWAVQIGPSIYGLRFATNNPTDRLTLIAFGSFLVSLAAVAPTVIDHNFYRYLHPLGIPLAVAGLCELANMRPAVVLVVSLAWTAVSIPVRWTEFRDTQHTVVEGQDEIASWLNSHAAPHTSVLVHDAGYLSEHTEMSLTDLVGLKTPASVAIHKRLTGPSAGARRDEAVHAIACLARPAYYVGLDGWERQFGLAAGLGRFGWAPTPVLTNVVSTYSRRQKYTLYQLTLSRRCAEDGVARSSSHPN
jgi:hypothetical protein